MNTTIRKNHAAQFPPKAGPAPNPRRGAAAFRRSPAPASALGGDTFFAKPNFPEKITGIFKNITSLEQLLTYLLVVAGVGQIIHSP